MFDKDAKNWVKENIRIEHSASFGDIKVEPSAEKGFQEGAEFGYNKANEWHYVKDGDLPKENKLCLLYLGSAFNPITGWYKEGYWYFEDCRNANLWQEKVIAWQEVVLPKE